MVHRGLTGLVILVMMLVSALVVAPLWFRLLAEHGRLKEAHSSLFKIAYTDRETGLPNLQGLERNYAGRLDQSGDQHLFIVRITNLDEISNLINTHRVSSMLVLMSERLQHLDIGGHHWARSGEAEFCCLLSKTTVDNAAHWAENLHASLVATMAIDGIVVRPDVSMAVAAINQGDSNEPLVLWEHQSNARLALHGFAPPACWLPEYEPSLKNTLKTRNDLINQISDGLKQAEFIPYYQIKVDAHSGLPASIEVLARWLLPDSSVVSPGVFIPAAESSGQIIELTYSIFDQVGEDIQRWCGKGYPLGRVALNVAGDVLHHDELIPRLQAMNSNLPDLCEGLEIEITENIALGDNRENTDDILQQIRELGMKVAIDDFGTGYASLQTLMDLPFDVLKVDRSFVLPMTETGDGQELVSAMIRLSRELDKRCVVEGVETEWQWKMLAELGCDELQGFYFHKPGPASEVDKVLDASYGWRLAA
jgi:EAL domain-containing protein (putative c-di-GMP-specific phosphodiesterase class I)/GGDEF domain-containing protein